MKLTDSQRCVLEALHRWGGMEPDGWMAPGDVATHVYGDHRRAGPAAIALYKLRDKGLVEGYSEAGGPVILWRITDAGREAVSA